jgi:hypothetical protein
MGAVFLARDTRSGTEVALKLLKPEFATEPRVVHRFLKEARHLQKLAHPNLVPVLEVVERKEGPHFVMPRVVPGSVARMLQPGVPLAPERALAIAADVAEALAFIHSKGLRQRPRRWYAVAGAVVAAGLLFVLWPHARLRVVQTFRLPQVALWESARSGDWNGDGAMELFVTEKNTLFVVDGQGRLLSSALFDEPGTRGVYLEGVEDVDGDGLADAWVSWSTFETNVHLSVVNHVSIRLRTFEAQGHPWDRRNRLPTTRLRPAGFLRTRENGSRLLIASVHTAYGGSPRGICCYDYNDITNQKPIWQYLVGPLVGDAEVLDLGANGLQGVVFGGDAPGNGNVGPDGTDDSHSYLFALSHNGELLWRTNLTDHWAGTYLVTADINGDDRKEVIAWSTTMEYQHRTNRWDVGRVRAFDSRGDVVGRYDAGACLLDRALVADLDGDGQNEILLTDCGGNLHVLGRDLRLVRRVNVVPRRHDLVMCRLIAVAHLAASPKRQIVLASMQPAYQSELNLAGNPSQPLDRVTFHDHRVLVLDQELKVVASRLISPLSAQALTATALVADVDGNGLDEILLLSDQVEVLKLK